MDTAREGKIDRHFTVEDGKPAQRQTEFVAVAED
jgi:hypothetical protein